MNKHLLFLLPAALMLAFITGCPRPRTTTTNASGDKTLTLTKPSDVSIVRNGNVEVTVKIARNGFRDPVMVAFSDLPTGVEPKDKDYKIAAEATSGTFTLHAKDDAPVVTNHDARVTVTGPDGMKQSEVFKLTVKEK